MNKLYESIYIRFNETTSKMVLDIIENNVIISNDGTQFNINDKKVSDAISTLGKRSGQLGSIKDGVFNAEGYRIPEGKPDLMTAIISSDCFDDTYAAYWPKLNKWYDADNSIIEKIIKPYCIKFYNARQNIINANLKNQQVNNTAYRQQIV